MSEVQAISRRAEVKEFLADVRAMAMGERAPEPCPRFWLLRLVSGAALYSAISVALVGGLMWYGGEVWSWLAGWGL